MAREHEPHGLSCAFPFLVGGLEILGTCFTLPYFGNDHPNWLLFFRGVGVPPTRVAVPCRCIIKQKPEASFFREHVRMEQRNIDSYLFLVFFVNAFVKLMDPSLGHLCMQVLANCNYRLPYCCARSYGYLSNVGLWWSVSLMKANEWEWPKICLRARLQR